MPAVSVLMAVYNGERHLAAALESILAQTHRDFELVIVDDGSTDRSRAIAAGYHDARVRIVALGRNVGLSAALNEGLRTIESPLVARQDADDLSEPERLERQLARMRDDPSLALLGTQGLALAEDGRATGEVVRPIGTHAIRWYSLFDNPFIHTSVMCRTAVVRDELGGFDGRYDPFSQDYALWCRLMARYEVANLTEPLVRYRVHSSSIIGALDGSGASEYQQRFARILSEIVGGHAQHVQAWLPIRDGDAALLPRFVLGLDLASLDPFLEMFERLLAAFQRVYPDAAQDPDLHETLARQFDALAYRIVPSTRLSSARVYAHAMRRHPEVAAHLSWSRAASQVVLGRRGRTRLASWLRR
jgi:glycosyltransferase involved in cell wall biosynthesis